MKMYVLNNVQQLSISREEAWAFLSNPGQLENITPEDMKMKALQKLPEYMYEGMIIHQRIQPFPKIYFQWVTEITHIQEGSYFIDEQRLGPFRFWHHEHRLIENKDGVELHDTIHYVMPFSILGRFVHRFLVRKKLDNMFSYRKKELEMYFAMINS